MKWIAYLNICLKVLTLTNKKEGATPSFVFILKKINKTIIKAISRQMCGFNNLITLINYSVQIKVDS